MAELETVVLELRIQFQRLRPQHRGLVGASEAKLHARQLQQGHAILHQPVARITDHLGALAEARQGQVAVGQPARRLGSQHLVLGADGAEADIGLGPAGGPGRVLRLEEGVAVVPEQLGVVVQPMRRRPHQVAAERQQEAVQL